MLGVERISMRLQDYWGIGLKTASQLEDGLGTERAIRAIESMDIGALVDAGLTRGRATRILRHAHGEQGMGILTTPDACTVYKDLLARAQEYTVTDHAGDRIRVLTPFASVDAMEDRLDEVTLAADTWADLDHSIREAVLEVFTSFDEIGGGDRAAVEIMLALQDIGVSTGVFAEIDAIDPDALEDAREALGSLDTEGGETTVREGVDDELDTAREQLAAVQELESQGIDVIEAIQSDSIRSSEEFREAFISYVANETPLSATRVREATPTEAADAIDFVTQGLRDLLTALRESVESREQAVANELEAALDDSRDAIETAVTVVNETAFQLSLARFARAYDLTRPTFVESTVWRL